MGRVGVEARLPFPAGRRGENGRRAATGAGRKRAAAAATARPAARPSAMVLRRDRHQPDYSILLAVVALAAIGILMVYSSSAMSAYVGPRNDTFAIVGPQIIWGSLGILTMVVVMRIDYRWLRLLSVPGYFVALALLALVFVPSLGRVVGGSARWLVLGPLPAVHPAEIAKLALIVYLAHWMANKGKAIGGFRSGTIPFFIIALPVIGLVFKEPDLGTTIVITLTAFTMFFVAGASLRLFAVLIGGGVTAAMLVVTGALSWLLKDYQLERIKTFMDPWADPLGAGFHTIQGLLALGLGGIFGSGLGESKLAGGLYLPNAWNDYIFAIIGEEFGFVGAAIVIGLFVLLAYAGIRTALRAPDTFGALLAAGITAWLCYQAFINIGVVVALVPVTGITLPFISAGGNSLLVSFAAAGILLSISRETRDPEPRGKSQDDDGSRKETGRIDATADRGRRDRGPHLPGARRRDLAPPTTRQA